MLQPTAYDLSSTNTCKVARKKFVDDFSILAVEKCLLEPLLTMCCPRTVDVLADSIIGDIAREDDGIRAERERLTEKVNAMKRALDKLHTLDPHSLAGEFCIVPY